MIYNIEKEINDLSDNNDKNESDQNDIENQIV